MSEHALSQLPDALARIAERHLDPAVLTWFGAAPEPVRLIGMGGSYNAATAALPAFLAAGLDARAELAATVLHAGAAAVNPAASYVLISDSGTSIETVRVAEQLVAAGAKNLLALTNEPGSRLAQVCPYVQDQGIGADRYAFGVFTANYLALQQLLAARTGASLPAFRPAAEQARALFADPAAVFAALPSPPPAVEYLGRGALVGAAQQSTLIMREIARVPAGAWDASNFRHGPIESAGEGPVSVVLASAGPTAAMDAGLARHLRNIQQNVLVVGAGAADVPLAGPVVYEPLLTVLPTVLLAYRWAAQQGRVAGEFRYTSHTITDEQG